MAGQNIKGDRNIKGDIQNILTVVEVPSVISDILDVPFCDPRRRYSPRRVIRPVRCVLLLDG